MKKEITVNDNRLSLEEFKQAWSIKNVIKYFGGLVMVLLIFNFVILVNIVPTASMDPLIKSNSFCVGVRTNLTKGINRCDVVTFKSAYNVNMVKRVIGMPGDKVSFENGKVLINNVQLEESYLDDEIESKCDECFMVPQDSYFLLGDNRETSADARYWENHYIKKEDIISKNYVAFGFTFNYGFYIHFF